MKLKKNVLKLVVISAVISLGIGLVINTNKNVTQLEAEQYLDDYAPYSYDGPYYEEINFTTGEGMNGSIRESITETIIPKDFYYYSSSGDDHLSTQLQYADEDPTNSDNMVYFYTRDSVAKNPATGWNREHVWCQSLSNGNWGTEEGGTDLLHIRPVYESVNSSRGNDPYADLNKVGAKYYEGKLYGYSDGHHFEPIDQVKGDVARIIMYMWTAYNDYEGYNDLNILDVIESYDTLLRWHTMDKPDALEGNRNDYVESSNQQNRNPFVDRPELAWEIFGNEASSVVKNACKEAYPSCGYAPDPRNIKTTLSLADYATANSLSSGDKVSSIILDDAVTVEALGTGNNGKVYIGTTYTEWRFYSSGSGKLRITANSGYELVSVKASIGTSNYGKPRETRLTITDGVAEYNPGSNFNVKSLKVIYRPIGEVEPTSISLNETSHTLNINETLQLETTVNPVGASNAVTWSSDDDSIASVDADGLVTAVGAGTTTITVTSDVDANITATCEITVLSHPFRDELTDAVIGTQSATYSNSWAQITNVSDYTGATYMFRTMKPAAGNGYTMQTNANGYMATTKHPNGAKVKSISFSFLTDGKRLAIYGSNTAYTAGNAPSSTSLGNIRGTGAAISFSFSELETSYRYVAFKGMDSSTTIGAITIEYESYEPIKQSIESTISSKSSLSYDYSKNGNDISFIDVAIRFSGLISKSLWNELNEESIIVGFGILLSDTTKLPETTIKEWYTSKKTNENTIDEALTATCANSKAKNFYKTLGEKAGSHPNEEDNNYYWNLYKSVNDGFFTREYRAVAYIRTEIGIVFLQETRASCKSLATALLAKPEYDDNSYGGSLKEMANWEGA